MGKYDVYGEICQLRKSGQKAVAWLIDPDRYARTTLERLKTGGLIPRFILVGGSLVGADADAVIRDIKATAGDSSRILIFPGDYSQLSAAADALLLLSLVSGRNPEYLIGQHVKAAPHIRRIGLEAIPTAYMLIDGGKKTSVEYISDTTPIPADKTDIAQATAIAAELLGMKAIYLEAGSGASRPVEPEMIKAVKNVTQIPLFVGGGLRSSSSIRKALEAGADIAVVGTAIERDPDIAEQFLNESGVWA